MKWGEKGEIEIKDFQIRSFLEIISPPINIIINEKYL